MKSIIQIQQRKVKNNFLDKKKKKKKYLYYRNCIGQTNFLCGQSEQNIFI